MAIEGPLRELALADVIQLLHLSRKTGRLTVRSDGGSRPGVLLFDEGFVVGASPAGEASPLGHLLVISGKATAGQVEAALRLQRGQPERRIGALLVETQGVSAAEVKRQLRFQVEETVFDLVRWREGYFRFDETPPPDPGEIRIRLAAESLLMESMRRADEWTELASGDPDASLVPTLVEKPAEPTPVLELQPQEWRVLAAVDGERTLREISREIGRGEFDVAKAVYGLAAGGVIELRTRPAGRPAAPGSDAGPSEDIRMVEAALLAGRVDEALRRTQELQGRMPNSGPVHLLRGRALARSGHSAEAMRVLEQAIELDPLLAGAYYHLGLAAARAGAFERARDVLTTFVRLPESDPAQVETATRVAGLVTELSRILEEER